MRSAHKLRFAWSCAVVALCCLPRVGTAQKQRSAQTQETPVFADELTRETLGKIADLNDRVPAGARMTPGPKSHMVVMGATADVWCPPGSFIELDPDLKVEGFKPVSVAVWEDGVRTQAHGLDETYTLRVNPPLGGVNRKRVNVILYDALGHAQPVMQCTVRSRVSNPVISDLDYKEHDEKCGFAIKDRQSLTNTCLYLGDMYLGRVGDNAGKVDIDQRLLPPGKYTCQMAGQNSDGIYVPGATSEFTVPSRYSIDCGDLAPTNIVIGEHDEKIKITVKHTPGLSIKKTRVYIAGVKAGEKEGDSFTMDLPMKKVPTGNCFIEVIGVAEDGVTYPVESLALKVKNDAWWQEISHTTTYERITENQAQIEKLWQDVCTNLERGAIRTEHLPR